VPRRIFQNRQEFSVDHFDTFFLSLKSLVQEDHSEKFDNNSNKFGMIIKHKDEARAVSNYYAEMLVNKYGDNRAMILVFESSRDDTCFICWKAAARSELFFVYQAMKESELVAFILGFVLDAIKNQHPGKRVKSLVEL
jgi:hypothetical protein